MLDVPLSTYFKGIYGAGGLSGNLPEMERSELRMYRLLHQNGRLPAGAFGPLLAWSLLKYFRREVVVRLQKRPR